MWNSKENEMFISGLKKKLSCHDSLDLGYDDSTWLDWKIHDCYIMENHL